MTRSSKNVLITAVSAIGMWSGSVRAAQMGWPDAVSTLARERSKAEICVVLLKAQGDKQVIARGQLAYGDAKANFDALISGLLVALSQGQTPNSLTTLEAT